MKIKLIIYWLAVLPNIAFATNGINLIGFGAESTLMSGADIAVARDTSALNTNPAGLTQISEKRFDFYGSLLRTTDLSHQDQFGNNEHASNRYTGLGGFGYAQHLENLPCTAGVGLFAQGGSGGVFEDLNTAFNTQDEFSALFAVAKLTGGLGCKINDDFSIGGSFGLVYAQAEQKVFPDTSVPPTFAGIEVEDATSLRTSFKLGMQYQVTPTLKLAASYTGKTELPLTGGQLKLNMSGAALGTVTYNKVKIEGLALPREIGLGAAYQMHDDLLIAVKLNWLNWADAMKKTTLTASDPDNASLPNINSISTMNWHNQWVIATGAAYRYDDKTTLYAGYNYGKNPIPEAHTTPLIAGIFEHHITLGGSYKYTPEWTIYSGLEYDVRKKVNYTNTEIPFGNDAQLRNEAIWLHFMVSKQW
ncbi:MAG: OmpP1/FadL family transporter [Methylophilus sp.]